jgi:radical SAM protein with 4Fe4S-binding SPASM domain
MLALNRLAGGARLLKANFRRLDAPLKVNLCVTYWCQYRCKTCNIWQRKPTDELTTDELLAFVRKNRSTAWLDVTGGEPFLRPDIGEIFEAVLRDWRKLVVLHFPTNGFLTDRIVSTVARLPGRTSASIIVTVSLDGDEALNDEIRGIKGGFRRQIATFKALRRIAGVRAVLGMTLSAHNAGKFAETFDACRREIRDLTPADFHLNVAQVSGHYYGNSEMSALLPGLDQVKAELAEYASRRARGGFVSAWMERAFLRHLHRYLDTGRTPMRCHALRSSCFVDPWGTVYPCITWDRPVGRLRETGMDLRPIWRSATAQAAQGDAWSGNCPQCWTACEAYQSILGNVVRPFDRPAAVTPGAPTP